MKNLNLKYYKQVTEYDNLSYVKKNDVVASGWCI